MTINYTTNMSYLNSSNTLIDIVTGTNNASGGIIGIGIMVLLFIGLLSAFLSKNYDLGQSMIATSFICSIVAGLLFFINLLAWWIAVIFIVLLIIGVVVEAFR
jgi:hypothetical protein